MINVTGSPAGLFGGATANVAITIKELQNVVVVPTAAIPYAGATTVPGDQRQKGPPRGDHRFRLGGKPKS